MISEKEKYIKVWENLSYRTVSPGKREAIHAIQLLDIRNNATINCFGCGSGKEAIELAKHITKIDINLIDIAHNCLNDDTRKRIEYMEGSSAFIQTELWSMETVPNMDYGFCVDVLEHIPPNLVEFSIQKMAERTDNSCYFCIAMFEDKWFGMDLHLTVRPFDWWKKEISKHFNVVYMEYDSNHVRIVGEKK